MTGDRGAATRRRLLDEAIRLFGQKGFAGTSLDAVATAGGVRKQTLLYYFPTKEALLDACVMETSERVAAELTEALTRADQGPAKAEAVVRALFRLAEEWPEFANFVREASRLGPETIQRFAAVLEPLRVRALLYLEAGMDDGAIRKQDPALLLFTLYTAVVGSITEAGVLRAVAGPQKGRLALKRREREVLAFVRAALAPRADA